MNKLIVTLAAMAITSATFAQESSWYPFTATGNPAAGEIGMQDWLDKPAGKSGRITRQGDTLMYNGAPIKLWGLNLCFGNCVPEHAMADKRAAFYPKYGINAVRLHKFTESDYQTGDSATNFSEKAIDRMDYQVAQFKKAGIYTTLSVHFGAMILGPGDKALVPYIDELGKFDMSKPAPRITLAHSALFYSPELQEVHIKQMVNLLKHRNPYTNLTYAEDPAIAFIENINEQSILFYTTLDPIKKYPTIRKMTAQRFSQWLKQKYGSQEGLVKAWGERAFEGFADQGFPKTEEGETIDKENILPIGNPWYWDATNLNGSQAFRKQRLLDTLQFLYTLQVDCYQRYAKALREAGYEGEILGSNWQAGSSFSHLANLHSDAIVGTVDRHNYFGGGGRRDGGTFNAASMLQHAGSGLLSSGLQQVADRPFMLSEWIHVYPSEWGSEGPAILGAYGMGLQGWDASFMFQNGDNGSFSDRIGRDQWDVTAPQVLGVFPAVARQIHRGDVKQSEAKALQNVHMPSLFAGKLSAESTVKQGYDEKEIATAKIPTQALAAVRTSVAFTDQFTDTPTFDLSKFAQDGVVTSSTGQLKWHEGKNPTDGFITIDTPGTKAAVGFASGQALKLGDVTISPQSRYAAIYVTAQGKGEDLASAKKILVVAMARARNTGMQLNATENAIAQRGKPPILLEPVKATIQLGRPNLSQAKVIPLDHDGQRTNQTIPVENGSITLDGTRDKTPYYLIEFAQ